MRCLYHGERENSEFQSTEDLAGERLKNQLRKSKSTPDILEEYDKIIKQQLQRGIVEEVPDNPNGNKPI